MCIYRSRIKRTIWRLDRGGLTLDLCWDGSATQIVEVEDEPMLAPPMWVLLTLEMVEEDGWKWVELGNKGGIF